MLIVVHFGQFVLLFIFVLPFAHLLIKTLAKLIKLLSYLLLVAVNAAFPLHRLLAGAIRLEVDYVKVIKFENLRREVREKVDNKCTL